MISIPDYAIERVVYAGRNTTLYKGRRLFDGHEVAVKVATHGASKIHSHTQAALRHEYEVLRSLDVPGVVRVIELGHSESGPALIMDMVPGMPLDQYLTRTRPGLREGLRLAIAIAETLGHVHSRSIVHKDIKPHHILYEAHSGGVKLVDFGIASWLEIEAQASHSPEGLEGTLAYLSPEQTGRVNLAVDRRSDLYSLGEFPSFCGSLAARRESTI